MLKKIYHNLPSYIQNYLNKAAAKVSNNSIEEFVYSDIGKNYNISTKDKLNIIKRINYSFSKIESATSLDVQLELGKKILSLNSNDKNYIVECGCYIGSSSVALSIFAKITDRKLIIYDSFKGLPDDNDKIGNRNYPHLKLTGVYKKGMYSGSKNDVTKNLKNFGEYDYCILREGYYDESLKHHSEKIDFLFLDVDLVNSTYDCIKYLWKYIVDDSFIFSDDACDIDVVSIWFDHKWWKENLGCKPPGYIGSGCGIPLGSKYSSLGYTIKNPKKDKYNKAFFRY